jgi:hypothetical protein
MKNNGASRRNNFISEKVTPFAAKKKERFSDDLRALVRSSRFISTLNSVLLSGEVTFRGDKLGWIGEDQLVKKMLALLLGLRLGL